MPTNEGLLDRILRVLVGVLLIAWALGVYPGTQSVWGWTGLIPLITGLVGYCPVYQLLGIGTTPKST
jgi:hypothetical protein